MAVAKASHVPIGSFFNDIDSESVFDPVVRADKRKVLKPQSGSLILELYTLLLPDFTYLTNIGCSKRDIFFFTTCFQLAKPFI
ncbi:hypothetical protein CSA56_13510 [candidate division KSB3 bacterium]|uniref:Uncharacterized protein n=1 Tax=candidate division KSB3 bacterium TaxID=2044937 RepID=A0A2G6KBD7_9BACT|nr:MAG: hypothetical protein CSA56_13510 [candidate division KSB3 bacterium]